ncbi:MAG: BrnT family toxin [Nitrospirales bacterium]|nr:BrnT family toxin [Nitrospirales bacterium]
MIFECDPDKAAGNLRKHNGSFAEAASVFLDPLALTFSNPDHSDEANRVITIGLSSKERVLFVSPCERGDRIRVIGAQRVAYGLPRDTEFVGGTA